MEDLNQISPKAYGLAVTEEDDDDDDDDCTVLQSLQSNPVTAPAPEQ